MYKLQNLLTTATLARMSYLQYWHQLSHEFKENPEQLYKLALEIDHSIMVAKKKANLVNQAIISYPQELPVSQDINNIREVILNNQIIILCGETGSGKTTQLPKLLLELGLGSSGIIGHTQPRRIATRSLASRIATEINSTDLVGYKMRFHDKTTDTTAIKLMTDGVLLQEISNDKLLLQYSAIILDEAHERSLNIDFLLGYLKQLIKYRPDFKLIITSATIDNNKLSEFFFNAPVINVSGKTYPVDVIYQPLNIDDSEYSSLNVAIYQAVNSCLSIEMGNILVFLPGEREIKDCISYLNKTELKRYQLLALYSRQSNDVQNLIFQQDGNLKIIITTNIAETSLTIPGIKYVIDSGIARIKRYSTRNRVEQLLLEPIAKSSAKQRAGRAGRLSHGMCIRLYSEQDYNLRNEYAEPELLRSNLANVILRLINLDLGDPLHFPFLDLPSEKLFNDGYRTLVQIGAINDNNQITDIGAKIANIPLDAQLAKILIAAGNSVNCLSEILIIVSFLAVQDPREIPLEFQQLAREKHSLWVNEDSELIIILNIWNWYHNELKHKKSHKKLIEVCRKQFISLTKLKEWHELYGQLKDVLLNMGYKENIIPANYESIHTAILSGFMANIGQKDIIENYYLGTNGKKFLLHPSSFIKKHKWILSCNLVETSKLYARTNAKIDPLWLLPITKHLVKYNYSSEHWSAKRGEVVANKAILLYGLLLSQEIVSYSTINAVLSRELMIKEGLVLNQLPKVYKFITHNAKVLEEIEKLEDKMRMSFILLDDEMFSFYSDILPNDVYDTISLDLWLKNDKNNMNKLCMQQDILLNKLVDVAETTQLYPEILLNNGHELKVKYIFDEQSLEDGMTILCELAQITDITPVYFMWLVPGLIRGKINYLLKSLPKGARFSFNPISEFITEFLNVANVNNNLYSELSSYIEQTKKITVSMNTFEEIKLPTQFVCHFNIIRENKLLFAGDNLLELKTNCALELKKFVKQYITKEHKNNIVEWVDDLATLLNKQEITPNVFAYISLIVEKDQINLSLISEFEKAIMQTKRGMLALIKLQLKDERKHLEKKKLNDFITIALSFSGVYDKDALLQDCINYIFGLSVDVKDLPTNLDEFNRKVVLARRNISPAIAEFSHILLEIAQLNQHIKRAISSHPLKESILYQLDDLIYAEFLHYVSWEHLQQYPRYLQAILYRLEKYYNNISRDKINENVINECYTAWYNHIERLEEKHKIIPVELYAFIHKIEELRISLFAPLMKTLYQVSLKRLMNELEKIIKDI